MGMVSISRAGWHLLGAALKERCGWQKAVVALANKNARIPWAVMTHEQRFDRHHVSIKPA